MPNPNDSASLRDRRQATAPIERRPSWVTGGRAEGSTPAPSARWSPHAAGTRLLDPEIPRTRAPEAAGLGIFTEERASRLAGESQMNHRNVARNSVRRCLHGPDPRPVRTVSAIRIQSRSIIHTARLTKRGFGKRQCHRDRIHLRVVCPGHDRPQSLLRKCLRRIIELPNAVEPLFRIGCARVRS